MDNPPNPEFFHPGQKSKYGWPGHSPATRRGNGAGWGGPAKGASTAPKSVMTGPAFEPGNAGQPKMVNATERMARREEQHEEQMDVLHDIAMGNRNAQAVQVQAITAFGDRVKGKPKQSVDNTHTGKVSLEQLVAGSMKPEADEPTGDE